MHRSCHSPAPQSSSVVDFNLSESLRAVVATLLGLLLAHGHGL